MQSTDTDGSSYGRINCISSHQNGSSDFRANSVVRNYSSSGETAHHGAWGESVLGSHSTHLFGRNAAVLIISEPIYREDDEDGEED